MKKLKKLFIIFVLIIIVLTIVIFSYSGYIIYLAKQKTPEILKTVLSSENLILGKSDLTQQQLNILLKVEDPNFYKHNGFDLSTPGAGLTTITQALVKQLYFEKFKPGFLKFKQTLIAIYVLTPATKKDDIINIFLNKVYLGNFKDESVYGFTSATKKYYNKEFKELTENEFISLVAMIIAPNEFNILKHPDRNKNRVERIKLLITDKYKPKSVMDLYYGGNTYRNSKGKIKDFLNKIIWGY